MQLCWMVPWKKKFQSQTNGLLFPLLLMLTLFGCKWVYRIKCHANRAVEGYKARHVTKGFHQKGCWLFWYFHPVIHPSTVCLVLSIALSNGWCIRQLDINNAFLNDDLCKLVFMEQPKGLVDPPKPTHVSRLHRALYGLKQAPNSWFNKLKT